MIPWKDFEIKLVNVANNKGSPFSAKLNFDQMLDNSPQVAMHTTPGKLDSSS